MKYCNILYQTFSSSSPSAGEEEEEPQLCCKPLQWKAELLCSCFFLFQYVNSCLIFLKFQFLHFRLAYGLVCLILLTNNHAQSDKHSFKISFIVYFTWDRNIQKARSYIDFQALLVFSPSSPNVSQPSNSEFCEYVSGNL